MSAVPAIDVVSGDCAEEACELGWKLVVPTSGPDIGETKLVPSA